ncbi:hypothetical protein V6N13_079846 [Hibiscus sabdariffa]
MLHNQLTVKTEKVTLLISTQHKGRINKVIEVKVGRDCFLVRVAELGLNFHPKQSDVPLQSKAKKSVEYSLGSSLDPSSVPDHATAQINESRFNCIGKDEVAKAICLEKGSLINEFSSEINVGTSLGEKEAIRSILNVNSVEAFGPSTQLDRQVEGCEAPLQRSPADEEMTRKEVGLSLSTTKGNIEIERPILSDGILPNIINRELECFTLTLPEFHLNPKSERIKRYDSLKEFQSKALSTAERKKLNRVRKRNKDTNLSEVSELEGRPLTDSDLKLRWKNGVKMLLAQKF